MSGYETTKKTLGQVKVKGKTDFEEIDPAILAKLIDCTKCDCDLDENDDPPCRDEFLECKHFENAVKKYKEVTRIADKRFSDIYLSLRLEEKEKWYEGFIYGYIAGGKL